MALRKNLMLSLSKHAPRQSHSTPEAGYADNHGALPREGSVPFGRAASVQVALHRE